MDQRANIYNDIIVRLLTWFRECWHLFSRERGSRKRDVRNHKHKQAAQRCGSAVREPHCQWRGPAVESTDCRFETGAIFFTTHCLCPLDQTLKAKSRWSLQSGVYARGSKRPHIGGRCVTRRGFTHRVIVSISNPRGGEFTQLDNILSHNM